MFNAMKILLVEDDPRIASPLAEDLRYQGHVVDLAIDGFLGLEYAHATEYDLILLDWMLPKLNGIAFCKQLRSEGNSVQILMLTARDTTSDKVIGLDAGADDYLVKPFELDELAARIRALSRRGNDVKPTVLQHGQLEVQMEQHRVTHAGQPVLLTPKEYMILSCFLQRPDHVFSKTALLDRLWEFDQSVGENTIKTHITNIRQKLRSAGSPEEIIETVYGVGYRLSPVKS